MVQQRARDQEHPVLVNIPPEILNEAKNLDGNKVILTFETRMTIDRVLEWIRAFNEEHPTQIILHDELHHFLFVV